MRQVRGCGVVWLLLGTIALAQSIRTGDGRTMPAPPPVDTQPAVDNYFGTKITDNYRWLEDSKSEETRAFIDEQNAYTTRYLKQSRIRPQVVDDLQALEDITDTRAPLERAGSYFFERRVSGEEQFSIYVRHGWTGKDERVIDPAALSRDANLSVTLWDVSRDGVVISFAVKMGGADESTIRFFDLKTKKMLEDELPSALYQSLNFTPDGKGVYYSRMNKQGSLLYLHMFGMRPSQDKLIFGREFYDEPLGPIDLFGAWVTDDGHYLVVDITRGVPPKREDIVFKDLTKPNSTFQVLVWGLENRFETIYANHTWFVKTDYKAPKGRIYAADPGVMPEAWKTIVPEGPNVIETWNIVGSKIYVNTLKDVKTETAVYLLDGRPSGTIEYEGIGSSEGVAGRTTDRYGFYTFDSFIRPWTTYRLDTVTGKSEVFFQPKIPFDTNQYELKQVFFKSKDGTQIPMFIAGKKGLKMDGSERLLMTGYGGFDLSETAEWNPIWAWWIEQGGWFALPNLRGGGEYGENWHEQGMFGKKQNVFDDFIAAAQYLIDNKYTSPAHFAISGRSNGGLLMGAAITQHPELFGAVWCGYPLLDMLRYQKFEQGPHWTTEYGSADDQDQFLYLLKYSPYQNVKKGTAYPAVMFFTGDSDTRVDPLHARKMTAEVQAASSSGRPILLHYSTTGGHSAGVSVEQKVQDDADQLTFLWTETGSARTSRPAKVN